MCLSNLPVSELGIVSYIVSLILTKLKNIKEKNRVEASCTVMTHFLSRMCPITLIIIFCCP